MLNYCLKWGFIAGLWWCGSLSYAYVPSGRYIIKKIVENHGRGVYRMHLRVMAVEPGGASSALPPVMESWVIDGRGRAFVEAKSQNNLVFARYYDRTHQYTHSSQGQVQKTSWSREFLEPWFFVQSQTQMVQLMLGRGVITREHLQWNPVAYHKRIQTLRHQDKEAPLPAPLLRLTRMAEDIHYFFSVPEQEAHMLVEQDRFVVRAIKYPKGHSSELVEVLAENYKNYQRGLKFPQLRKVRWDEHTVQLQLQKLEALSRPPPTLSFAHFRRQTHSALPFEHSLWEEFYQRFR